MFGFCGFEFWVLCITGDVVLCNCRPKNQNLIEVETGLPISSTPFILRLQFSLAPQKIIPKPFNPGNIKFYN